MRTKREPRTESDTVRRLRYGFYVIYLAFALGFNGVVLVPQASGDAIGSYGAYNASWAVAHGVAVLLFITMFRQNASNFVIVLIIGGFFLASALWSATPSLTLMSSGVLAVNLLVAHMIASDLDLREIFVLLARVIVFLALVGMAAYFLGFNQVVYIDTSGRSNIFGGEPFRGFFVHKIRAALYATIGALAVQVVCKGWVRVVLTLLLILFVLMTGSATGLVVCIVAFAVYLPTLVAVKRGAGTVGFTLIAATAATIASAIVALNWGALLAALGRDETLTGRTLLWDLGLRAWAERPWGGWGFASYFSTSDSTEINRIGVFRNYDVPHFHQSFIQTAVDFGWIGFLLLVLVIGFVLIRAYSYATRHDLRAGVVTFACMVTLLIASLVMYLFFDRNQFATILLFVFFFALLAESGSSGHRVDQHFRSSSLRPRAR